MSTSVTSSGRRSEIFRSRSKNASRSVGKTSIEGSFGSYSSNLGVLGLRGLSGSCLQGPVWVGFERHSCGSKGARSSSGVLAPDGMWNSSSSCAS
jgi:hypothetical protein